jgi:hypothetical protein
MSTVRFEVPLHFLNTPVVLSAREVPSYVIPMPLVQVDETSGSAGVVDQ